MIGAVELWAVTVEKLICSSSSSVGDCRVCYDSVWCV